MGQPVHLTLYAESEDAGLAAAAAAFAELRRIEAALSIFDPDSDFSELNRRAGRSPIRVGPDAVWVVASGEAFRRLTGGGFNLAVEPLMRAWGFRAQRQHAPSPVEIAEAEAALRATRILTEGNRISLPVAHTALDPGGIGVGSGLDRAAGVLRAAGINRALLDVSGDCIALGAPPGEGGWQVEIVDSSRAGRAVGVALLRDAALATSANTVSVVRYAGVTRGHVMDPADGYPARALTQVTVQARTGVEADALSTAMLVTGREAPGVLRAWMLRA